jgi:hypothetical protein
MKKGIEWESGPNMTRTEKGKRGNIKILF